MKLPEKEALEIAKKAGVDPADLVGVYKKPKSTIAFWIFCLFILGYMVKDSLRMAFAKGFVDKIVLIPSAVGLSVCFVFVFLITVESYYLRYIVEKKKIILFEEICIFQKIFITCQLPWDLNSIGTLKLKGYKFNKKKISNHILRDNIATLEIRDGFENKQVKKFKEKVKTSVWYAGLAYLEKRMFNMESQKEKIHIPYENNSDLGEQISKLVPSDCEVIIDK